MVERSSWPLKHTPPRGGVCYPVVHVALALIKRRGRYLVCRRRAGRFLGGYWEFPGGKCEAGESWEACLRRELGEELGVRIRAIRWFGIIRHRYASRAIRCRVFRCAIARGEPKPLVAECLRWVSARELMRRRIPPANRSLVARLALDENA